MGCGTSLELLHANGYIAFEPVELIVAMLGITLTINEKLPLSVDLL